MAHMEGSRSYTAQAVDARCSWLPLASSYKYLSHTYLGSQSMNIGPTLRYLARQDEKAWKLPVLATALFLGLYNVCMYDFASIAYAPAPTTSN